MWPRSIGSPSQTSEDGVYLPFNIRGAHQEGPPYTCCGSRMCSSPGSNGGASQTVCKQHDWKGLRVPQGLQDLNAG